MTFAKTSTNIQSQLNVTLKQGGQTRPWRGLSSLLGSVLSNCASTDEKLKSILRERKKQYLLADIDEDLLRKIHAVLQTGVKVFDTLEQSKQPTIQNVVPAFYLVRNAWSQKNATDDRRVRSLKKELMLQLDDKVWSAITAVHLAATYLDPTLRVCVRSCSTRSFTVRSSSERLCYDMLWTSLKNARTVTRIKSTMKRRRRAGQSVHQQSEKRWTQRLVTVIH